MKSFRNWLDSEVVEEASSDAYEAAIAKVSDMFDYLKTLITRTWGGEKGRVSVDDRAKRMAVSHLRNVMKMLDPESVSESVMSDYIGVKKRSSGNYDLDELLTAMRDKIVSMIAELRNSAVIDTIKHSKGEIMGGIKGIGTDLRRLRTGDQGVTDVEEARYNLQDLANSLSPNEVIYYKSANGTNVPAAVDPSNHESLESLLNLIMKGGSSQVVVAEKGKPKKGRAVDLNRTGRVAQIRSDRMGVQ